MMHATVSPPTISLHRGAPKADVVRRWNLLAQELGVTSPSRRLEWLNILRDGLGHEPIVLEARNSDRSLGMLPLAYMRSTLFGTFLVSLPYLNIGGPLATCSNAADALVNRAVQLANDLQVKHLELRNETRITNAAFNHEITEKVHMRLELPSTADELWRSFSPKVRNQIRKAERSELSVEWGSANLLGDFYKVFSHNMRDLGTPVFSRRLFSAILVHLGPSAEVAVVRSQRVAVAAAILVHGSGMSEVPSASSLRAFNHLNGNMLLYWHMLVRSIERGQQWFDFGRSSVDSSTYRFKRQWDAKPYPAVWQYYVRSGNVAEMRPSHPKNQRRIAVWKCLPVWLTRIAGPTIVRGIP